MTFDPKSNNQGTPAPQPVPGQEPGNGQPASAYITQEQLSAILEKQRLDFAEQMKDTYRGIQSMSDRTKSGLAQLDGLIKQLQQHGQTIDPAVVQRMKTDIISEAYNEPQQPAAQPTPPGQGGTAGQPDPLLLKMQALEMAMELELTDNDPEVEKMPFVDQVGEKEFLKQYRIQLEAKRQRLANDTPDRALARSPFVGAAGTPSSNPIGNVTDTSELWTMAMNQRGKRNP